MSRVRLGALLSSARDGTPWGGPFWEVTASLRTVLIDPASRRGIVQQGTPLSWVVGESDPPSAISGLPHHKVNPQSAGVPLEGWDLGGGEVEDEGATAAHGPALVHADVAGSLGR